MRKKVILFLLSAIFVSLPLSAQTEEDAKKTAIEFLRGKLSVDGKKLTSVVVNAGVQHAKSNVAAGSAVSPESNLYAFNISGGGFALVCTGNGNTAVAGYSDTGKIDVDNMPDAMRSWLEGYQMAMAQSRNSESKEPNWSGATVPPVAPLIKTKWGQYAPYNIQCPSNGKQTALAGCVPVALAQVLNYYHQDRKGGGRLYYAHLDSETEYDIDYSTTTYDWANMLNEYDGNASEAQKNAVGKLILECGVACKATYGYTETSATSPFVALNKYYNYECMYVSREENYYNSYRLHTDKYRISTKKWMTMIQDELEAGRPIIYSASDLESTGSYITEKPENNHCFVLDGIDDRNYVHVNWGWTGFNDGYYDVAILNPGTSFNYEQGYRCRHTMIIGIQPRTTDYQEEVYQTFIPYDWANRGTGGAVKSLGDGASTSSDTVSSAKRLAPSVVTSKSLMYFNLTRNSYESKQTKFAPVLTRNGVIHFFGGTYTQSVSGYPGINEWNLYHPFQKVPTGLDDGVYDIRMAYWDENGKAHLCPFPKQITPTLEIVNGGTGMIFRGLEGDDYDDKLVIENITPASEVYAGTTFYLYLTGRGTSQSSKLLFRNVETNKVYGYYSGAGSQNSFSFHHIYNDYTSTHVEKFIPKNVDNGFSMPAGRYKVELPEDEKYVSLAKDFYIDVQEKPAYPVFDGSGLVYIKHYSYDYQKTRDRGYDLVGNHEILTNMNVDFNYANKNNDPIDLKIYLVNKATKEEKLLDIKKGWVYGQTIKLNRSLFPIEGDYEFEARYLTPDGERPVLTPLDYGTKDPRYNYRFTYDERYLEDYCQMVSADIVGGTTRSGGTLLKLGLKTFGYKQPVAVVKGLFYDEKSDEIIVDSVTNVSLSKDEVTTVVLSPELSSNTKYQVTLLHYNENMRGIYNNLLNPDKTSVELTIVNHTITGVSTVSTTRDAVFKTGEQVVVYDLQGRMVKKVTASAHVVADILSSLPSGTYVLKSPTKTIKLRN